MEIEFLSCFSRIANNSVMLLLYLDEVTIINDKSIVLITCVLRYRKVFYFTPSETPMIKDRSAEFFMLLSVNI